MHQGVKLSLLWDPVSWQHSDTGRGMAQLWIAGIGSVISCPSLTVFRATSDVDFKDQVCCGCCLSCTWIIPPVNDHNNNSAQPYCRAGSLTQSPYGGSNLRGTARETMCQVSVLGPELYFYMVIAICEGLFFPHCIARDLQKQLAQTILIEGGWIILGADFLSTAFEQQPLH